MTTGAHAHAHAHCTAGERMDFDSEYAETLTLLVVHRRRQKRKELRRSLWVRPIFAQRKQQGSYSNLVQEMRLADPQSHFRYFRMSKETFDTLLGMVTISIQIKAVYSILIYILYTRLYSIGWFFVISTPLQLLSQASDNSSGEIEHCSAVSGYRKLTGS